MVESSAIALVFSEGPSSRMLREVITAIGCRIAYECSVAAFTPDDLAESGASIVVVDLGPDAETDSIFELLDDDRYRVIVNDAEVTNGLTGWEHARWARHLAAKILDVPAVVDPPRPEETSVAALDAIASLKSRSWSESRDLDGAPRQPSSSGVELGIDDWLSEVLQVKNPEGLFVENALKEQARSDATGDIEDSPGAKPSASESRRMTDHDAKAVAEAVPVQV